MAFRLIKLLKKKADLMMTPKLLPTFCYCIFFKFALFSFFNFDYFCTLKKTLHMIVPNFTHHHM